MYELKNGKVFTSKYVGTGPSSYEKRIYRSAVSQRLRNTVVGSRASEKVSFCVVIKHTSVLYERNIKGKYLREALRKFIFLRNMDEVWNEHTVV